MKYKDEENKFQVNYNIMNSYIIQQMKQDLAPSFLKKKKQNDY